MAGYVGSLRALPVAWEEFGREAGLIVRDIERATGEEVLLVGMDKYFVASQLAFYNRQDQDSARHSVGRGVLGRSSLMYDYWFAPNTMQGRTAILFALKRSQLMEESFDGHFGQLSEVAERGVYKDGQLTGSFFYRIGYDLRPRRRK